MERAGARIEVAASRVSSFHRPPPIALTHPFDFAAHGTPNACSPDYHDFHHEKFKCNYGEPPAACVSCERLGCGA
eukprot:6184066-Pleurochrysis_carterae.AAC.7